MCGSCSEVLEWLAVVGVCVWLCVLLFVCSCCLWVDVCVCVLNFALVVCVCCFLFVCALCYESVGWFSEWRVCTGYSPWCLLGSFDFLIGSFGLGRLGCGVGYFVVCVVDGFCLLCGYVVLWRFVVVCRLCFVSCWVCLSVTFFGGEFIIRCLGVLCLLFYFF